MTVFVNPARQINNMLISSKVALLEIPRGNLINWPMLMLKTNIKEIKKVWLNLNINYLFLFWLFLIYLIFFIGFKLQSNNSKDLSVFDNLKNWDSGHFLGIAKYGYKEKFQFAFFPMYPILINFLAIFLKNYLFSALIISILSTFLALKLLYKLICMDNLKLNSKKAIFFILIFPTSFYFLIPYSEALFFFFVVATFYFLRLSQDKKANFNLFLAGIFACLSALTRISGVAVILALLLEIFLQRKLKKYFWVIFVAFAGIILYMIFLFINYKDPIYFLTAESHWQRSLNLPVISFWQSLVYIFSHNFSNFTVRTLIDLVFAIFGVGFVLRSFRFLRVSYSTYALVSILLPLSTSTLISFPRFLLPIFPIFLLLGLIKNRFLQLAYILISILILIYFEINFINGKWVS